MSIESLLEIYLYPWLALSVSCYLILAVSSASRSLLGFGPLIVLSLGLGLMALDSTYRSCSSQINLTPLLVLELMSKSVVAGLGIALLVELPAFTLRIIENTRGAGQGEILSPATGLQAPALEHIGSFFGVALLFCGKQYQVLVSGILEILSVSTVSDKSPSSSVLDFAIEVLKTGVLLTLPLLALFLVIDLTIAVGSRFINGFPISSEFSSVKLVIGLLALVVMVTQVGPTLPRLVSGMLEGGLNLN